MNTLELVKTLNQLANTFFSQGYEGLGRNMHATADKLEELQGQVYHLENRLAKLEGMSNH